MPETPIWLLSKNREDDALASLQWLRGWVSPKAVQTEFQEMKIYYAASKSCEACRQVAISCSHPPAKFRERIKEISRKRILKPFAIVIFCFAVSQFSGMNSIRAYMVQIFKAYEIPFDANWATVVVGVVGICANIICMCAVKMLGKRKLFCISLAGSALSSFGLGIYALTVLPKGLSSFDINVNESTELSINHTFSYSAIAIFVALNFFVNIGVMPIPWMLLSEVFPFKARGLGTGLSAAINYIMIFIFVKNYINLETTLKLSGTMFAFGIVYIIGLAGVFLFLPETEGRTLEEIEIFFSDNKRKMIDGQVKNAAQAVPLIARNIETLDT